MNMDLAHYRAQPRELERTSSLMSMVPAGVGTALDVGARDGHISRLLADKGAAVTALDLECPVIDDPRIACVQGDATSLTFADRAFDLVLCAEVLEHVPTGSLERVCSELARVAGRHLLIGVPYRQDIRVGRLTCGACGGISPPWGHVNTFDEKRLQSLFPGCRVTRVEFVGVADAPTNALSAKLMDMAGNPWGDYGQDEPCIHCGSRFTQPPARTTGQRLLSRAAIELRKTTRHLHRPHGNWMHVTLEVPKTLVSTE